MTPEFNKWWDKDLLTEDNPYEEGTPAFWAWEGWLAGVKAEREACARICQHQSELQLNESVMRGIDACTNAIRIRGNK